MAKRKYTRKAKAEATAAPAEANGTTGSAAGGVVSKMDAVRKALEGGVDKPADGVAYVKQHFGIELPTQMFSSYKSQILKKQGGQSGGGGRSRSGGGDMIDAARAVRELVEKHGADTVRELVDLFDR